MKKMKILIGKSITLCTFSCFLLSSDFLMAEDVTKVTADHTIQEATEAGKAIINSFWQLVVNHKAEELKQSIRGNFIGFVRNENPIDKTNFLALLAAQTFTDFKITHLLGTSLDDQYLFVSYEFAANGSTPLNGIVETILFIDNELPSSLRLIAFNVRKKE